MKLFSLLCFLGLCVLGAHAQNTGYRSDIGILSANVISPAVNPQASLVILPPNSDYVILAQVRNYSDYTSVPYRLVCKLDGKPLPPQQASLRRQEVKEHRWSLKADTSGNHQVTMELQLLASPMGGPQEDNPRNNGYQMAFQVAPGASGPSGAAGGGAGPDLVVDGFTPSSLRAMDKTVLEIRIGNKGTVDVPSPVDVELEVGGRKTVVKTNGGIPAGKTGFATYELPTMMWEKYRTCKITVDPGNRVKEADETNNGPK